LDVYLIDGTYELFRHFFALPSHRNGEGREVAAARGVLGSILGMLEGGVTHLGVATDKVIESFRNQMWPGYKTSAGVDPQLLQQFPLLEEGLEAMGVALWPMVELEADDALASAAAICARDAEVDHVYICSPDKDLAQCVSNGRVFLLDRRKRLVTDDAGVIAKFGVPPQSIPDYLALVGDSADGYPGLPGWGARSTAAVLARYGHLEDIPARAGDWQALVRGADKLSASLHANWQHALLFRDLARLRGEEPLFESAADLEWHGPQPGFAGFCNLLDAATLAERALALQRR
jgi:5'-3' exonuclease